MPPPPVEHAVVDAGSAYAPALQAVHTADVLLAATAPYMPAAHVRQVEGALAPTALL